MAWKEKTFVDADPVEKGRMLSAAAINDFKTTETERKSYGALVALVSQNNFYLYEFQVENFQPELKNKNMWFASMGSGQYITDPFLGLMKRVYWEDSIPALKDAIFIVTWALKHCIDVNTGGIDGPEQIAVIEMEKSTGIYKARILDDAELAEHRNNAQGIEEHLGKYRDVMHKKPAKIPEK